MCKASSAFPMLWRRWGGSTLLQGHPGWWNDSKHNGSRLLSGGCLLGKQYGTLGTSQKCHSGLAGAGFRPVPYRGSFLTFGG